MGLNLSYRLVIKIKYFSLFTRRPCIRTARCYWNREEAFSFCDKIKKVLFDTCVHGWLLAKFTLIKGLILCTFLTMSGCLLNLSTTQRKESVKPILTGSPHQVC